MERFLVAIVGAGFAGLGLAIRLRQRGIEDFVVLEQAPRLGGVWRDNVYPGVACDVPVHLYSYSFAPNPHWSRLFAPQAEILDYLERCAEEFGVRTKIRCRAVVTTADWDETRGLWTVATADGRRLEARALVCASGLALSRPLLPKIPGLDAFAGSVFHSSRWDASAALDGKAVAVIGTGASAVQIIPQIAPRVARLHVFQRTPPWVASRPDRSIASREQALFRRHPIAQKAIRSLLYWYLEALGSGFTIDRRINWARERVVRRFLQRSVPDPVLRAKLTPTYALGCKRILFSNDYYPALCRANVEVVTSGIREIRERTIVTDDGRAREADAIVCATGFEAADARVPFALRGREGRPIEDAWKDGVRAYLGTTVPGFPNLYFLVGPNMGLGHSSMIFMMESQYPYVLGALRLLASGRVASLDVKEAVTRRYNEQLQKRLATRVWSTGGCASWYTTAAGLNTVLWPGSTPEFRLRLRRFDRASYEATGWPTDAG